MSSMDTGIAQELADEQRQTSIAEFFEKNKQMLGFGSENRALVTAVKEGVDNSLDAAEEARIFPEIIVTVEQNDDYYTVTIEDNGPGIPEDSVPNVFGKLLYGSRFHREMQQRGQQGIGISAAVLYSQLTTGNPARILSKTAENDRAYFAEIGIDTDNNTPEIHTEEYRDWDKDHGIRIELDMVTNLRSRKRLHRYIKHTAVSNPHATLELHEPKADLILDDRPVNELPDEVEEIKPHPHGIELGTLMDMLEMTDHNTLTGFFTNEFTRVGRKTADEILTNFARVRHGKWIALKTDNLDQQTVVDAIKSVVNNKGTEPTNTFATNIYDHVTEQEFATYTDVVESVKNAAETTENQTDKQFGETVQENAVEAVYNQLTDELHHTLSSLADEHTIKRKPTQLVQRFAEKLTDLVTTEHPITETKLRSYIETAADEAVEEYGSGSLGETAQNKIFDAIWSLGTVPDRELPSIDEIATDRDIATQLLNAMKQSNAMAPPKKCISPITEDHILKGLQSRYDADFYTAETRSAKVHSGKPFVVEAGLAYGGSIDGDGPIKLQRFANRVPLVYQQGACIITKQVKSIQWNNYYRASDDLSQNSGSLPTGPMVLVVHVASTNVPFTSESKDAIASVPDIEKEIELAVRGVARNLKNHLKQERKRRERKEKQNVIGGILEDITEKIERVTNESVDYKQSQAKILNSIYARQSGEKTVRISNHNSRTYDVTLIITTEKQQRKRTRTVEPDESTSVSVPEKITDISIQNIDESKVIVETN